MPAFTDQRVSNLDITGLILLTPFFMVALIATVFVIDGRQSLGEVVMSPIVVAGFLFAAASATAGVLLFLRKPYGKYVAYVFLCIFLLGFPVYTAAGIYGLILLRSAQFPSQPK